MSGWAGSVRDTLRTQLWPLPTAAVIASVVAALLLVRVDASVDPNLSGWLYGATFSGDADAARTVLDAIAGSLITVTSLTFSLTVVTLQLASSQFSPRLLRTFTRDLFVQLTLALFLGTFVYALSVLRSVRGQGSGTTAFVPRLSVSLGFLLAIASVLGLVSFLAHLTRQIRVETMLRVVHAEASGTMRAMLVERTAPRSRDSIVADGARVELVLAAGSGFVVRIDAQELVDRAVRADVVVAIDAVPGDFVVAGTPVGRCWSQARIGGETSDRQDLLEQLGRTVHTGPERTQTQDIRYGLRQLVDVANKALSPGINDPTTAVHALGRISAVLCEFAGCDLVPTLLADDNNRVRVVLGCPDLAELVDLALTQPRLYGASDPLVLSRLFVLLAELAWHVDPQDRNVVADQLQLLREATSAQDFDEATCLRLNQLAGHVDRGLTGHWVPPRLTP